MSTTLKPVVYLLINGERFHWADRVDSPDSRILDLTYEETDGTGKLDKKRKGRRNTLKFTVINYDPNAPEQTRFLTDTGLFKAGNSVKFRYGFEGSFSLSAWQTFKIVEVDEAFPAGDIETVTVICHDDSKEMNLKDNSTPRPRKRENGSKEDTEYSLADVAREICEEHNFQYFGLDQTPENIKQPGGWMQSKQTDIEFLSEIAATYGLDVYVKSIPKQSSVSKFESKLYFGARTQKYKEQFWGTAFRGPYEQYDELVQKQQRVIYAYEFKAQVNTEAGATEVNATDVDTKNKEEHNPKQPEVRRLVDNAVQGGQTFIASSKDVPTKEENVPGRNKKDTEARLEAAKNQSAEATIKATLNCLMHPLFHAQTLIKITGRISNRWKKSLWYVETMRIHMSGSQDATMFLNITKPPKVDDAPSNLADTSKNNKSPQKQLRRRVNSGTVQGEDVF